MYTYAVHDSIENDNTKIIDLINQKNNFTQEDWNYLVENYDNVPIEVANEFIVRKEDLGKKAGINLEILIYNQDYPEDFYLQEFIKELLDITQDYYQEIMDEYYSRPTYGILWQSLLLSKQHFFSEKFILDNAEHFIGTYQLQRYQTVPIEFYEKYIDDKRLHYIQFQYCKCLVKDLALVDQMKIIYFRSPHHPPLKNQK